MAVISSYPTKETLSDDDLFLVANGLTTYTIRADALKAVIQGGEDEDE